MKRLSKIPPISTIHQLLAQIIEHKKKTMTCGMEIHVLVWDRHKKCGGLNRLMGPQTFPS
jgi:hypothetical protein